MIVEIAVFTISAGHELAFEQAFSQARLVLAQADGHLGHELLRSHEQPSQYSLLVRWRRLQDHTEGFRGSPLYQQWRALLQEHFAQPPQVSHLQPCAAPG